MAQTLRIRWIELLTLRWLHGLIHLHPRRWQSRFGSETSLLIDEMLAEGEGAHKIALDLVGSALSVRARRLTNSRFAPPGLASLAIVVALVVAAMLQTSSLQPLSLKPGELNPVLVREMHAHHADHVNQVHWSTVTIKGARCQVGIERDNDLDPGGPLVTSKVTICIPDQHS